jgi:hypothetical protein
MNAKTILPLLLLSVSLLINQSLSSAATRSMESSGNSNRLYIPFIRVSPQPIYANVLVNGSFEEGWTDVYYFPGNLTNQQPNGWLLTWVEPGQQLYNPDFTADGVAECVHKLSSQLPPDEQLGGENALILDGEHTYDIFFGGGGRFGVELRQTVTGLLPGSEATLIVPVQVHQQSSTPDHVWHAYSGAWLNDQGEWLAGGLAGDRTWYEHTVTIAVPENGEVEVVIRFQTLLQVPFDFFTDNIRLMSWVVDPDDL